MLKEGQVRIPSGCAIAAVISREGNKMTGEKIIGCMRTMHDRNNGLGGGFAAYGIYPEYKEQYALHLFYDSIRAREETERFLKDSFEVVRSENIPTRKIPEICDEPLIYRYFVSPLSRKLESSHLDEAEYVARDPPEGKDDASGSPTMSDFPVSCMMTLSPEGSMKLSCFSAVRLVSGWNQWV